MNLPTDLWETILEKTRSVETCDKLYDAFLNETRVKLKETYKSHKERITFKIVFAFNNTLSLYYSDCFKKEVPFQKIMAVKIVKTGILHVGSGIALRLEQIMESFCFGMRRLWITYSRLTLEQVWVISNFIQQGRLC